MIKRVFIIHGWDGFPEEGWFPWLKKELENKKFKVVVPSMPNSNNPTISSWVDFLISLVKEPDYDTYFVGHSIGCQTILRYLETLDSKIKVGGVIMVSGWLHLRNLETEEERCIAEPWIETPIKWDKIRKHTDKFIAIFSSNDPFVPVKDSELFKKNLNAKIIIEDKKGHFSGEDKIKELPVALNELLKIIK